MSDDVEHPPNPLGFYSLTSLLLDFHHFMLLHDDEAPCLRLVSSTPLQRPKALYRTQTRIHLPRIRIQRRYQAEML